MIFLRSIAFYLIFIFFVLSLGIIALPLAAFNKEKFVPLGKKWVKLMILLLELICRLKIEIQGTKFIPKTASIIVSKHQSIIETIVLWELLNNPAFIMKKELLKIPVLGFYCMLLNMIYIDRSKGISSIRKINASAKQVLESGRSIVIFPEGTRVKIGDSPKFKGGLEAIHQDNPNAPLTPVALNSGRYWPKGSFKIQPGKIIIRFLPPFTANNDDISASKNLHKIINDECDLLI